MRKLKIWGWDKKERTMLRFIKPGDIFCFKLDKYKYCFGRIIVRFPEGDIAEIFDYLSDKAFINENDIEKALRLIPLVVLDSYSLFDRKAEGEWRIIGHQEKYIPHDVEDIYFTYGSGTKWEKIDLYGNVTPISAEERLKYILLAPKGDKYVKECVLNRITN